MISAIADALGESIKARLSPADLSKAPPLPPDITAQMQQPPKNQDAPSAKEMAPEPPIKPPPEPETQPIDTGENAEIVRRRNLLADYKLATNNPSNKKIYEARNSGVYKPQFYEWLHGVLPVQSETTKNFERFLREKKPPVPRKS
jgi:hypothetical protein